jgi:hypothetical protein
MMDGAAYTVVGICAMAKGGFFGENGQDNAVDMPLHTAERCAAVTGGRRRLPIPEPVRAEREIGIAQIVGGGERAVHCAHYGIRFVLVAFFDGGGCAASIRWMRQNGSDLRWPRLSRD